MQSEQGRRIKASLIENSRRIQAAKEQEQAQGIMPEGLEMFEPRIAGPRVPVPVRKMRRK